MTAIATWVQASPVHGIVTVLVGGLLVLALVAFIDWHYSEPQRRKRAVRRLVRGGGRR